ncbi:hypothetical protein KIN20_036431 [Parelaphostrongylus tenuis]|uniref:Uncharacterized protein n=1 Tax=Parelaphostrongylus tenuis TaxID=148309 RepID=A0AAD5WLN5_PARTN|nr:hypothetical protein KIN20_036431 [Parelaphostrongylus tenuis]
MTYPSVYDPLSFLWHSGWVVLEWSKAFKRSPSAHNDGAPQIVASDDDEEGIQ